MSSLANKRCQPCTGSTPVVRKEQAHKLLVGLSGWAADADGKAITATFEFDDYYQTISFVNAIAWMANQEDHHPDLEVSYKRCVVRYTTHAVAGLSENDFICAAKVQRLIDPG